MVRPTVAQQDKAGQGLAGICGPGCAIVSPPGFGRVLLRNRKQTGNGNDVAKKSAQTGQISKPSKTRKNLFPSQAQYQYRPRLDLAVLDECQRGNPASLLKLLEPLQNPHLALQICLRLKNGWKPPKKLGRCDAIAYHYDVLLMKCRGEGKLIRPRLMKQYEISEKTLLNYHHSWRKKLKAVIARAEAVKHTDQDLDLLRQLAPDYLRPYSSLISMLFQT